jgi:hypothetical protein
MAYLALKLVKFSSVAAAMDVLLNVKKDHVFHQEFAPPPPPTRPAPTSSMMMMNNGGGGGGHYGYQLKLNNTVPTSNADEHSNSSSRSDSPSAVHGRIPSPPSGRNECDLFKKMSHFSDRISFTESNHDDDSTTTTASTLLWLFIDYYHITTVDNSESARIFAWFARQRHRPLIHTHLAIVITTTYIIIYTTTTIVVHQTVTCTCGNATSTSDGRLQRSSECRSAVVGREQSQSASARTAVCHHHH